MPGPRIELLWGLERALARCRSGTSGVCFSESGVTVPAQRFQPSKILPCPDSQITTSSRNDCFDFLPPSQRCHPRSSYCRLLSPRKTSTLFILKQLVGRGGGDRTHVRSLGSFEHPDSLLFPESCGYLESKSI